MTDRFFAVGDRVTYLAQHPGAVCEHGIVKSLHPEKKDIVFVVYKCGGDWAHYANYTAAATNVESLTLGWVTA